MLDAKSGATVAGVRWPVCVGRDACRSLFNRENEGGFSFFSGNRQSLLPLTVKK